MLSLGQLYTDDTNYDNNDDDDDDDNNANDNDTQRTNDDCIGSLACMPIEPKSPMYTLSHLNVMFNDKIINTVIIFYVDNSIHCNDSIDVNTDKHELHKCHIICHDCFLHTSRNC